MQVPLETRGNKSPLEETCRLVQSLAHGIVGMHVQFLGLVDLFADTVKQHGVNELLSDMRLGRNENTSTGVHSIGGPSLGLRDIEEGRPVGHRWKDFERLRERTGFVAR